MVENTTSAGGWEIIVKVSCEKRDYAVFLWSWRGNYVKIPRKTLKSSVYPLAFNLKF
jgi:hypothetical protein